MTSYPPFYYYREHNISHVDQEKLWEAPALGWAEGGACDHPL